MFHSCHIHHVEMVLTGVDFCGKKPPIPNTIRSSKKLGHKLQKKSKNYIGKTLKEVLNDEDFGCYLGISTSGSFYIDNQISLHYSTNLTVRVYLLYPNFKDAEYRGSLIYSRDIPPNTDIDTLMTYKIANIVINKPK